MSERNYDESYPPPFRSQQMNKTQNFESEDALKWAQDSDPIPVIDLQSLNLKNLDEACKNWGVFHLVNHGVPPTLLNQIQQHAKKLFSLSFESKQALITTPLSYFWGTPALTPSGSALSTGPQNINWVEGCNIPLSQLSQFQAQDPILASFRLLLEEYGRHLARIATTIYEGMVKSLNLDPTQSKSHLSESTGYIRAYRYPDCGNCNDREGINVHTDSSVVSILSQDEVGGLEVLNDDKWFRVAPVSNTLIVNLGDMMQAISNDEYKSAIHRVRTSKEGDRISVCYFVFPADDCLIQTSNYKPFTYTDFRAQVQQDIKNLGFKVGLERFKLTQTS